MLTHRHPLAPLPSRRYAIVGARFVTMQWWYLGTPDGANRRIVALPVDFRILLDFFPRDTHVIKITKFSRSINP